ncbi:MAG: DUF3466 family protein, partial [Acidimicrobiia bacterium]|nr:DUF3466 family protein [Acidimicrobiia bacterium]
MAPKRWIAGMTAVAVAVSLTTASVSAAALESIPAYEVVEIGTQLIAQHPDTTTSTANDVNEDGDVVGYLIGWTANRAFFYSEEAGPVLLPLPAGAGHNEAVDLTERDAAGNVIIVGLSYFGTNEMATFWRVNAATGAVARTEVIGVIDPYTSSVPTAINNAGVVVGYFGLLVAGFATRTPMIYDVNTGVLEVLDFPATPADINNNGLIAGGTYRGSENLGRTITAINDQGWAGG